MTSRAHLHHLVEKIRRIAATKAVHGVELFHRLKIHQLVRRRMRSLVSVYGMSSEGSVMSSKTILRDSLGRALTTRVSATANQAFIILQPERRKSERAMVLIIVVHCRGSPNVRVCDDAELELSPPWC
jgi:hypothetical protein